MPQPTDGFEFRGKLWRRRRLSSSDDVVTLIAGLGGDAAVPAIYDARRGITQSANVVSAWTDYRGGGFGPAFAPSPTKSGATWDPAGLTLTGDGTTILMQTAASSLFDLSGALSLFYVGNIISMAISSYGVAINDGGAFVRYFQLNSLPTNGGIRVVGDGAVSGASAAAQGATRRCAVISKTAGAGTWAVEVPNTAKVTVAAATADGVGNNLLYLFGDRTNASSTWQSNTVRSVLVLNRAATVADVALVNAWAQKNHAAVAA